MENRNDDDAYAFIPATIKLTPYDRRLRELRSLREKRELAISSNDQRRMAELDYQIKKAEERLEEEKRRDADEKWRRLRDIDDWRSRNGRASRNAGRRKVRNKPNEDLSHMTPAQKRSASVTSVLTRISSSARRQRAWQHLTFRSGLCFVSRSGTASGEQRQKPSVGWRAIQLSGCFDGPEGSFASPRISFK